LKGILMCGACGRAMKPSHTRKGGRLYRYYTCQNALKNGYRACPLKNIAAREIEGIVLGQLQGLLRTPEMVVRTWKAAREEDVGITEQEIIDALKSLDLVWEALFPGEQHRLLQLLVDRVTINRDEIEVSLRGEGLNTLARDLGDDNGERAA
ncbi:MAG: zinc ribbon domain-containing protein, partial [Magnetococcus sp. THC-1_WYH]